MTNFEESKEEEEVWPTIRYNYGMPLRGMKKKSQHFGQDS
jgi:hypothetical protein